MVEKRKAEATIDKPADEVWGRVRDFGDVSWIADAEPEHAKLEGNLRTVGRDEWGDWTLVQRLVNHDDEKRTYSYDLPAPLDLSARVGQPLIVEVLNGTLTVEPKGDSQSYVTWTIEAPDAIIGGTHAEYQASLDKLKAELDG